MCVQYNNSLDDDGPTSSFGYEVLEKAIFDRIEAHTPPRKIEDIFVEYATEHKSFSEIDSLRRKQRKRAPDT